MSYTSKYTGPEIDSLLSSIGGINATKKVLWEGNSTTVGDILELSDSVENYDYICIETVCVAGGVRDVFMTPSMLDVTSIIDNGYSLDNVYSGGVMTNGSDVTCLVTMAFLSNHQLKYQNKFEVGTNTGTGIRKVTGIKFAQSSLAAGSASNPIGAIVPIMGTQAPKDHLVCDGAVLNISEYKELADYFEKQFGSKNHFGGDGTTTFAIPDLRNEFLRGYGELSGEIGEHQDATEMPYHCAYISPENGQGLMATNFRVTDGKASLNEPVNTDSKLNYADGIRYYTQTNLSIPHSHNAVVDKHYYAYTSRPTNVAVLFCIKYTESGSANGGSSYKEVELLDAPVSYALANTATVINQELVLKEEITNYDEIVIDYSSTDSIGAGNFTARAQCPKLVSCVSYNKAVTYFDALNGGSAIPLNIIWNGGSMVNIMALVHFRDARTLSVGYTISSSVNFKSFEITSIKGIKY